MGGGGLGEGGRPCCHGGIGGDGGTQSSEAVREQLQGHSAAPHRNPHFLHPFQGVWCCPDPHPTAAVGPDGLRGGRRVDKAATDIIMGGGKTFHSPKRGKQSPKTNKQINRNHPKNWRVRRWGHPRRHQPHRDPTVKGCSGESRMEPHPPLGSGDQRKGPTGGPP